MPSTAQLRSSRNKIGLSAGDPQLLPRKRAELAEQAAAIGASIAKTPEVEATLSSLMRNYDNLQVRDLGSAQSKTSWLRPRADRAGSPGSEHRGAGAGGLLPINQ